MTSQPLVQVFSRGRPSRDFEGFTNLKDYVERFSAAVGIRRSRNLIDDLDPAEAMDAVYKSVEPRPPNPAYHFVLSWRDEHVPHDEIWDTVESSIDALGMRDHQWLSAIHADTAHTHAHVLCNRIHPLSHRYWRTGGRDHQKLMRAIGATRTARPDDYITSGANTVEVQHGQMSFQRWLQLNVAPVVDKMLLDGETWDSVKGRLADDFGLRVERGAAGVMLLDDHPLRWRPGARVHRPLTMSISALRLTHDFDRLERLEPQHSTEPLVINRERSYVAAFSAYQLPTKQTRTPAVAPLFERFVQERSAWYAHGIHDARQQRALISRTRALRIAELRREYAESSKAYLRRATPDEARFFRSVARRVLAEMLTFEIREIRVEARRQHDEVMARYPHPVFRRWLKNAASAGDLDAKNAIFSIRTAHARAQLMQGESQGSPIVAESQESTVENAADHPPVSAPREGESRPTPIASIPGDPAGQEEPDGIRRARPQKPRRADSLSDALAAFGDRETAEKLVLQYRTYVADFVARDPTKQNASQLDLGEKRRRLIEQWARTERKSIDQMPEGAQEPARALHLARRLRNEAAHEEARAVQQAVIENVVHETRKATVHEFLHHLEDPEADRLAELLPLDLSFAEAGYQPHRVRDRRVLKDLEATQLGSRVTFSIAGTAAFDDRGDHVTALPTSTAAGDRAALEYAVAKFGEPIELTGSHAYKRRMLALAVEMGVPVANDELAEEQAKLIAEKLKRKPADIPSAPAPSDLSQRYDALFESPDGDAEERSEAIRDIVREALQRELAKDRPAIASAADGAAGRLDNVIVFHRLAFAVVRNAEGEHIVEVPRDMAADLAVAIGDEHDLTRARLAALDTEPRNLDELVRQIAERAAAKPSGQPPEAAAPDGERRGAASGPPSRGARRR